MKRVAKTINQNVQVFTQGVIAGIYKCSRQKIQSILKKENNALFQARFYRNRCAELKKRIRELEYEKEGVRYFWRNQILEGQSRAGKMLKLATNKQNRL